MEETGKQSAPRDGKGLLRVCAVGLNLTHHPLVLWARALRNGIRRWKWPGRSRGRV